jgi:hypothetical protein
MQNSCPPALLPTVAFRFLKSCLAAELYVLLGFSYNWFSCETVPPWRWHGPVGKRSNLGLPPQCLVFCEPASGFLMGKLMDVLPACMVCFEEQIRQNNSELLRAV